MNLVSIEDIGIFRLIIHPKDGAINPIHIKQYYVMDWYDGPISGLVKYKGVIHYFDLNQVEVVTYDDDNEDVFTVEPRIYNLYKLTPDQIYDLEVRHKRFQEMVGTHWDYDEKGNHTGGKQLGDKKLMKEYYDTKQPDVNPKEFMFLGTFS